jgi:hypothetical protein
MLNAGKLYHVINKGFLGKKEILAKQVWEARTGLGMKGPRGRPRRTWNDNIQELFTNKNITWKETKKLSEDRTAWRALCKTSTP